MKTRKRIVVITHERETCRLEEVFTLGLLTGEWRRAGYEVEEVRGTTTSRSADIGVLHVDLSVVPKAYVRAVSHYPVSLNLNIVDIRKSALPVRRVLRNDDWSGAVIVKTELNYGGRPERRLSRRGLASRVLGRWIGARVRIPSGRDASISYRSYNSIEQVPTRVWNDSRLIVEKFLPEVDGELFVLRKYLFLGDQGINYEFRSRDPIARGETMISATRVDPPPEILELPQKLGIDFGRFDYVLRDGRVVLFDVNKTPSFHGTVPSDRMKIVARELAPAIEQFF